MTEADEIYFKILQKLNSVSCLKGRHVSITETELESVKQFSILTNALTKPLAILRSFGNNPLYFKSVRYGNSQVTYKRFDHKYISWLTLYSFIAQLSYISGFAFLANRLFSGAYQASVIPGSGRKHATTFSDVLLQVFVTTFFMASCTGAAISFTKNSQLAQFLNGWKDLVFKFVHVFKTVPFDFRWLTFNSNRSFVIAIFLGALYTGFGLYTYGKCIFDVERKCRWIEREQSFLFFGFGSATVLNTTFEHFKFFLSVNLVGGFFSQITKAVTKTKEIFVDNEDALHELFCLVYKVRNQARLLMKIAGLAQLFILCFLFVLTIVIWLLVMELNAGDVDLNVVALVTIISVMQSLRFLIMSYTCEKVVTNEKVLVEEVSKIEPFSLKARIELQTFVNVLTTKPTEFRLDNVITFRRALLLGLISNSTSYLIAILQLVDITNGSTTSSQSSSANNTIL